MRVIAYTKQRKWDKLRIMYGNIFINREIEVFIISIVFLMFLFNTDTSDCIIYMKTSYTMTHIKKNIHT